MSSAACSRTSRPTSTSWPMATRPMTPPPPPTLVDKLVGEQLDMVVGARRSEIEEAYRRGHRLGNAVFTGILARLFGRSFSDILSGYRIFSRRFVKSFPALSRGFETETEISVHALELAMPVGEVVTAYGARPEGSHSKLSTYRDGLRIMKTILHLFRIERPVLFYRRVRAFAGADRGDPVGAAGPDLPSNRARAALSDGDPGDGPDDRGLHELHVRSDPGHGRARPARGAAPRLSGAAGVAAAVEASSNG